jgi:hypothetical protein
LIWSEENDDRLRALWAVVPHLSYRQIGQKLGGASKNAVRGRAARIGLTLREQPARLPRPPRAAPLPRTTLPPLPSLQGIS